MQVHAFSWFVVILSIGRLSYAVELRRDDKWPPPEALVVLASAREDCEVNHHQYRILWNRNFFNFIEYVSG